MSAPKKKIPGNPRSYPDYCRLLDKAGGYCTDPIGKCLREAHAPKGVPLKDIQYCMRDSDTFAAYLRGERLGDKFRGDRAQQGWLIWIENFSRRELIPPHEVAVDWISGVFHQVGTTCYGCVSDVVSCLYDSRSRKNLLPAPAPVSAAPIYRDAEADIESQRAHLEQTEPTTREALIQARRGQGMFREQLIFVWAGKCAVTKCTAQPLLRASHIKPWRDSTDAERLNRYNGLMLSPNLDAAFDRGLISFSDQGAVMISTQLSDADAKSIGILPGLRLVCVFEENKPFLALHRQLHGFEPITSPSSR